MTINEVNRLGRLGPVGQTGQPGVVGISQPTIKVICINLVDGLEIGKIYDVWDMSNKYILKNKPEKFYHRTDFKTIEEHRQDKLNKLGI